jgi:putative phosphoribosyl transferase
MSASFRNRDQAGRALAGRLLAMKLPQPIVVLALPRGGVPIGLHVARALHAPLDLVLVRKIGAPMQPELAVAAVVDGEPPDIVDDEQTQAACGVSRDYVLAQASQQQQENVRRREAYLHGRPPLPLEGATAIVVDDGIATGTTVRAALLALRRRRPARLVLAVPVAPVDTLERLRVEVDDVVCLVQPQPFHAIGLHYADFRQVDDEEVRAALDAAAASAG